jgi:hypothetical protein
LTAAGGLIAVLLVVGHIVFHGSKLRTVRRQGRR